MKSERALFAKRFASRGWAIYDRLSVDVVRDAVQETDDEISEQGLTAYHLDPDNLQFLGYRFQVSRFEAWKGLYERAVERTNAHDYLSAIPLILIIIDGICLAKTGKHPFSGGADAPVFDSETSAPGGLAKGLETLGSARRKLDTNSIESPYRHGILHGLNPSFDNALVAAKSFNLLQAMVDYIDRRDDEDIRIAKATKDQRQPSWSEVFTAMSSTNELRRQTDEWRPRPAICGSRVAMHGRPHSLASESPEAAAATYLDALVDKNFGTIARMTIDYPLRAVGYRAGRHRDELGELVVTGWQITGIRDEAAAVSIADVELEETFGDRAWSGPQTMRLIYGDAKYVIYGDAKYDVMARGAENGSWSIMPNFLPTLWATALASIGPDSEPDTGFGREQDSP